LNGIQCADCAWGSLTKTRLGKNQQSPPEEQRAEESPVQQRKKPSIFIVSIFDFRFY
jgi:hypothetical protein